MASIEQMKKAIDLELQNVPYKDIAKSVGISERQLYNWRHDSEDRYGYQQLKRENSWQCVSDMAPALISNMRDLAFNASSDNVRFQTTKFLLGLGGYVAKDRQSIDVNSEVTFIDDIPKE